MASVLVVDDERSVRRSFALFLQRAGHEVRTAADAEAGLAEVEADAPDVLLTDVILPQADGFTLARWVHERWPEVHIMIMTGEPTSHGPDQAKALGVVAYLQKPIRGKKVCELVELTCAPE